LWLRNDLRLHDQPALAAACATGAPVIPLYILDDDTPERWTFGSASRWWLHGSLASLDVSLRKRGSRLVLARGPALNVLADMARETGAGALYWSRGYEPWAIKMERALHRALESSGVRCRRFSGHLLFEPEDIRNQNGEPFRLFTPYYKACRAAEQTHYPASAPAQLPAVPDEVESDRLDSWGLLPAKADWAGCIAAIWTPGEEGARTRLKAFAAETLDSYEPKGDLPAMEGTSRLSPHLHFGEISPREVWSAIIKAADASRGKSDASAESFLRKLVWREFSHHLLFHLPHMATSPIRHEFSKFAWREGDEALQAWKEGRTGYPVIDAGMRELTATGWMHDKVRVIVASFLVKHLLISWQQGAAWFWDRLVDADLASNSANWQRIAGCGAEAEAYRRILNPVIHGRKFDVEGNYVKAWVPELAKLPKSRIHEPWKAGKNTLAKAGITLGETYPERIVELSEGRMRALEAFEMIKPGKT